LGCWCGARSRPPLFADLGRRSKGEKVSERAREEEEEEESIDR